MRRLLTSEFRELAKNTSYILSGSLVYSACAFAQSVVVARHLGLEVFGAYVLLIAGLETTIEFCNLNAEAVVVKYAADANNRNDGKTIRELMRFAYICTGLTLFFAVMIIAVFFLLRETEFPNGVVISAQLAVALAFARGLNLFDNLAASLLRVYNRVAPWAFVRGTFAVFELAGVTLVCFSMDDGYTWFWAVIIVTMALAFLRQIALLGVIKKYVEIPKSDSSTKPVGLYAEIAKFVLSNSVSRTIKTLHAQSDILLLGALATPAATGLYATAKKMLAPLGIMTSPLAVAIYPQLANLLAKSKFKELRRLIVTTVSIVAIVSVIALTVLWWQGESLITGLYGSEFAGAYYPMQVILFGYLLGYCCFWLVPLLQASGRTMMRVKVDTVNILLCTGLNLLLIPRYGDMGAAATLLFAYVFATAVLVYGLRDILFHRISKSDEMSQAELCSEPASV